MKNYIVLLLIFLMACDRLGERAIDTKEIAQQIKARKPRYITEQRFLKFADEQGNEVVRIAQKALSRKMNKAIETGKVKQVEDFGKIDLSNLCDSLGKSYQIKIKKISFQEIPANISTLEQKLIDDYQNNTIDISPQTKFFDKNQILFVSPIILDSKLVGIWSVLFDKKTMSLRIKN